MPPTSPTTHRPPLLPRAHHITGRAAVSQFWQETFERFPESRIENLAVEEIGRGTIRRTARLRHLEARTGRTLDYTILQTTEVRRGAVASRINELM